MVQTVIVIIRALSPQWSAMSGVKWSDALGNRDNNLDLTKLKEIVAGTHIYATVPVFPRCYGLSWFCFCLLEFPGSSQTPEINQCLV